MNKINLKVEQKKPLKVYYDNQEISKIFIDLFIENVKLKSVENLLRAHEAQLVNYLKGMEKEIGLLINFAPNGIEVKRKYRQTLSKRCIFSTEGGLILLPFISRGSNQQKSYKSCQKKNGDSK